MARSTHYAGTKRDQLIPVRVTGEEKARIVADAKAVGLNTSDYLRARALGPESTPEVAAATHNLANSLDGLEEAVLQARNLLDRKE
jgi:hypothetical protein